jgi:hypothetical protein
MGLDDWNDVSQIVVAFTAAIGATILLVEYLRSKKNQRFDIAIDALKKWDDAVTEYTGPAIRLIEAHKTDLGVLNAIRSNQDIILVDPRHREAAYGYLIDGSGKIPGDKVNRLRFALMHYLNAWEHLAYLYNSGRADPKTIDAQLRYRIKPRTSDDFFSALEAFMDIFPPGTWAPFKEMIEKARGEAKTHPVRFWWLCRR